MLKPCRHRQRANTMTDLDPDQVIATLAHTLPPLSVNSLTKTSLQMPWAEGKPHLLPGAVLQAGAGTDTVRQGQIAWSFLST